MKSDPTLGLDAARIQLERAALCISASGAANTPWGQAALLTVVECAVRSFRGGVYLGEEFDKTVCVGNWMPIRLRKMLSTAGCRAGEAPPHAVRLHIGSEPNRKSAKLYCWTDGWVGAVGPSNPSREPRPGNELSGALAGAMAATEAFRMAALSDLVAGKRTLRLSPLTPDNPEPLGMDLDLLPSAMWLLGLGNLGQALLWVLGLLPYSDPSEVRLVLQDTDACGPENQDIQILTKPHWLAQKKARMASEWARDRGFQTTINELPFGAKTFRESTVPGLAFVGVDNIETRRFAARVDTGFDLVIDAGLGSTPPEIFDIRIHGFPGSREPSAAWPDLPAVLSNEDRDLGADWRKLIAQGRLDRCGAITIAGQSVGIPSTAVAAATIQVAQACRAIKEARFCDLVDVSLANPSRSTTHETVFSRARFLLFEEARRSQGNATSY